MSNAKPVHLGVAGLGGYARTIIDLALQHGPTSDPPVALSAVCDPSPDAHPERVADLRQRGVAVETSYDTLLTTPGLEAVWLPVPIDLHLPFAKAALAAGKAVMVEKPVTGTVDELDDLIAARDAVGLPVVVGFQDVYDTQTLPFKRRLLGGEFGPIQRVSLHGCWPRNADYFNRAGWAGAMRHRGSWVLDSPVNNAMAHFINIVLFVLGPDEARSAVPTRLEAELYRCADIENYDTASLRISLQDQADFLVLLTHAADDTVQPVIDFHTERGRIRWTIPEIYLDLGGNTQTITRPNETMRPNMLQRFARLVRGIDDPDIAAASLEVARVHTTIVNGASQAAPITDVPASQITAAEVNGSPVQAIPGIQDIFAACAADGQMLHESGRLPFTYESSVIYLNGYKHFAGPAGSHAG